MGRGKLGKGGISLWKKVKFLVVLKVEIVLIVMIFRVYFCVIILSYLLLNSIFFIKLVIFVGFGLGSKVL